MLSEFELIEYIAAGTRRPAPGVVVGIGDDCAVLQPTAGMLQLVSTDALIESVHFDRGWHPPELLGAKAASVNISDIAAMGGIPRYAFLALGLPVGIAQEWVKLLLDGFMAKLAEHGVVLIGGDTVRTPGPLMLTVTVIGEAPHGEVCYRSGARPGEVVLVSGPLGGAAAGLAICRSGDHALAERYPDLVLAHLDPAAKNPLGRELGRSGLVSAMLDTSDGLATDLAHLCRRSGVGIEINAASLPMAKDLAAVAAALGEDSLAWTLRGGEDYQLVFTAAPDAVAGLVRLANDCCGHTLFPVGRVIAGAGVFLCGDGARREISMQGYDHFG